MNVKPGDLAIIIRLPRMYEGDGQPGMIVLVLEPSPWQDFDWLCRTVTGKRCLAQDAVLRRIDPPSEELTEERSVAVP